MKAIVDESVRVKSIRCMILMSDMSKIVMTKFITDHQVPKDPFGGA